MKSYIKSVLLSALVLVGASSCTNLDEEVFDQIMSTNYYQTSDDIIRAYVRPFEHSYWSITSLITLQENSADQIATYNRNGDWLDGQFYQRYHYHTWTIDDSDNPWVGAFQGYRSAALLSTTSTSSTPRSSASLASSSTLSSAVSALSVHGSTSTLSMPTAISPSWSALRTPRSIPRVRSSLR